MEYKEYLPVIIIIIQIFTFGYLIAESPWWHQCLPDLLVEDYTTNIVGGEYLVEVTVANVGCAKSDECLVYCNAVSLTPPVGENEIRAQRSWILEELQPNGDTAICSFSFDNQMLGNQTVGYIEILVDAKVMVEESNENNNRAWWSF